MRVVAFCIKDVKSLNFVFLFIDMEQGELFNFDQPITLDEVFEAYFECRKHKRGTLNALAFELDFESNLIKLWQEINNKTYQIGRSIAFIVNKPVKREIFAADFRDRIVHHLIIRKLEQYFEHIFSPNSCSCRKGKGTLYAVRKTREAIIRQSARCVNGCYVLKLDIQAFFMSVDCQLLYQKLKAFVHRYYVGGDKNLLLWLIQLVVLNRPQQNCIRKGKKLNWADLPPHKSLFYAQKFNGMPIGNLTSQIFANFYLNEFDSYIESFKAVDYIRYVDDFVVIHPSRNGLKRLIKKARDFLKNRLKLILHPKKVYLQHYKKGFNFIGVRFKGNNILSGLRLKSQFLSKVREMNEKKGHLTTKRAEDIRSFFNSYCGYLRHLNGYQLRLKAWRLLKYDLRRYFSYRNNCLCVCIGTQYNKIKKWGITWTFDSVVF